MRGFTTPTARPTPDIEFAEAERALFDQIEFDAGRLTYETHRQNGERVEELFSLLNTRGVIPEHRVRWFTDPGLNPGRRGKSRQDQWQRNGTAGREVLYHPNFLSHFRYFLCGPDLPPRVMRAFRAAVDECGMVTSSDIPVLSKRARALARESGARDADEFYKLALDCGLGNRASFIRDAVRSVR